MCLICDLGGKSDICDELRKTVDVCCLQEVRWKGQGGRMFGMDVGDLSCGGLGMDMGLVVREFC